MEKMLSQLLPCIPLENDIPLLGVTDDSRNVLPGYLFLAISGENHVATEYITEAAAKSAAAIVCETDCGRKNIHGVPVFVVANIAIKLGQIASEFHDNPSHRMQIIAVTGTNGKTSFCHYLAMALTGLGRACGVVGTLGYGLYGSLDDQQMTTPGALSMQNKLYGIKALGADATTLEASSHGLIQGRLDGTRVNVAVFTNLSRDHLDYHKTIETYAAAKRLLFARPELETVVLNVDDALGRQIRNQGRNAKTLTYSINDTAADIYCETLDFSASGFWSILVTPWGKIKVVSSLLGEFNVSNLLAVIAVLGQDGYSPKDISAVVAKITNAKGRMELLHTEGRPTVVIDYAHTPDALEKAIVAIRLHFKADIWCVMGCGGNRDKGKRPIMGGICGRLSQHTVITDDNPRFESSTDITRQIVAGMKATDNVVVISDRRRAIKYALRNAKPQDVVLITGKGHEQYQEIEGKKYSYSDYIEIQKNFAVSNVNG
ncbi:MAG: UDP-N-acetylmuramoyl-L-alanyl-D-glutamate--2,6-diaminopimelate ligase [Pseudomonadales bacterium]|nr:UDP-N-acetylmuramoyl-L-alanyl-D-glutamate--2,6-diaminopimelate ligase [Pseudomonadales bacterium]